jgi:hypothetical protein
MQRRFLFIGDLRRWREGSGDSRKAVWPLRKVLCQPGTQAKTVPHRRTASFDIKFIDSNKPSKRHLWHQQPDFADWMRACPAPRRTRRSQRLRVFCLARKAGQNALDPGAKHSQSSSDGAHLQRRAA